MNRRLTELLDRFAGRRVAVIGDLVTDVFIYGEAARVSREAPVLIVEHERDQIALGGAANAAHNVKALGGEPILVGLVGDDVHGEMLLAELRACGIDTRLVFRVNDRPTITKQRIVASGLHTTYQQLVRVDRGSRAPVQGEIEERLLAAVTEVAQAGEALVASDYGYGVFSPRVVQRVIEAAHAAGKPALVDSRYQLAQFRGADLLTPNEPEAAAACGAPMRDEADVRSAAEKLLDATGAGAIAITRGKKGMYLRERRANKGRALASLDSRLRGNDEERTARRSQSHDDARQDSRLRGNDEGAGEFLPVYGSDQIADVTGAGDTVMATFALAAAAGVELPLAARLATVAAGLAVMKHGAAVVPPDEIRAALEKNPWLES
jgi:rfaE bifunctional protein kinase chain/domain